MEMRREIQLLEEARDRELEDVATRYRPVSLFTEPVLEEEAYEMYVTDSERIGLLPRPRAEGGLRDAMETFGPIVRENKVLNFLREEAAVGERKAAIRAFVEKEILSLTLEYKRRQAGKLRSLLAALGGAEASSASLSGVHDVATATVDDDSGKRPRRECVPDSVLPSTSAGGQEHVDAQVSVNGRPDKRPKHGQQ